MDFLPIIFMLLMFSVINLVLGLKAGVNKLWLWVTVGSFFTVLTTLALIVLLMEKYNVELKPFPEEKNPLD